MAKIIPMNNLSIPNAVWNASVIVFACTALKTNPKVIVIKIENSNPNQRLFNPFSI